MEHPTKYAYSDSRRPHPNTRGKYEMPARPQAIRQQGQYSQSAKPVPDNNPFFEERSNPLSSKGN